MSAGDAVVVIASGRQRRCALTQVVLLCAFGTAIAGSDSCSSYRRIATSGVTPNTEAASYLAFHRIQFDELWRVPPADLERIGSQIYRYVRETSPGVGGTLAASVSAHLDKYFAECVGLLVRGDRQIFCNTIHLPDNTIAPQSDSFTGVFDGGANALTVIMTPALDIIVFERQDGHPTGR